MLGDLNAQLIKAGDGWLSTNLAPVLTSSWFQADGIVIITWDEGVGTQGCCGLAAPGGQIATIVVTAENKGLGSFTGTGDHYGTLRAMEEQYNVPLLRNSGPANNTTNGDLTPAFGNDGSISGTVFDTQSPSHAIVGATVNYTGTNGNGTTTTTAGGVYSFTGVAPGSYTVSTTDTPNYVTVSGSSASVSVTANTTTKNVGLTLAGSGGISGTVSDTQIPAHTIVGATVTYSGTNGSGSTTTTTGGVFSFTGVPPGSYTVSTTDSPNYVTVSGSSASVTVTANAITKNVALTLAGSGGISGTVSDTQNPSNAIVGAAVTYTGTNGSGSTTTTSGGLFSFTGVPPGSYTVATTDSPNYATTTGSSTTVSVTANTITKNVALKLAGSGGISGTVFDTQSPSNPIVGATVTYSGTNGSGSTTTTSGGNFSFTGVPPGSYTVATIDSPNYVTTSGSSATEPVTAGTITSNVALTLTGSGGISGTVYDTQNPSSPIVGATVTYSGTNGSGSTTTTTGGVFAFTGVPPGTNYTVSTTDSPNYVTTAASSTTVSVAANTITKNVMLTLTGSGGISGTVFDTQSPSNAIVGATVTYSGTNGSGSTTTTSGGNFSFTGVPTGSYTVATTDLPNYGTTTASSATEPVTAGTITNNVALTLTGSGGISGTVTDTQSNPIVGATVTYSGANGNGSTTTTTGGAFSFTGVPPGTNYTVSTTDNPNYVTDPGSTLTVTVYPNASSDNVALTLTAVGGINGTVTTNSGTTGLPTATVTYTGPAGSDQVDTSDMDGAYQLIDVPDGTYSVTASDAVDSPGYQPETFTVTVTGTASTMQPFQLTAGLDGSIAGTVTDAQTGQPIVGVTVNDGGSNTSLPTDSAGNYVIESEPAGNYTASVTAPGYVTGTASVTVANDANTQTIFALTEDGTISGTVTDAQTHATIVGARSCAHFVRSLRVSPTAPAATASRTSRQARHIRSRQASVAIQRRRAAR